MTEVGLELKSGQRVGVHAWFEKHVPAFSARLGAVHGEIGVPKQTVGMLAACIGKGDADAGADDHLASIQREGPLELRGHGLHDR